MNVAVIRLNLMISRAQAEESILDCDGSCRDITFTAATRVDASNLVRSLATQYRVRSANDNRGIERSTQITSGDPFGGIDGYVHIVFDADSGMIPVFQLFVDHDRATDEHFVEITFFPDDVDRSLFSLDSFFALVDNWNSVLKSDDYFVRYENVSWTLNDTDHGGVICSRKNPPAG